MKSRFLPSSVWRNITQFVEVSSEPWLAAIAYFGQNADKLLPARKGSRLVVNASEAAIKAGQTHPATLLRLLKAGVEIYSVTNLHAKVVVVGRKAVIGSANASMHSANSLVEAAALVSDAKAVAAARCFIGDLCQQQLTPKRLIQLSKLYRPPAFTGGVTKKNLSSPVVAPLYLEQIDETNWSEDVTALAAKGRSKAKKKRTHSSGYRIDEYNVTGRCRLVCGNQVIQVTDQGAGRVFVSPPGTVLNVEKQRIGGALESIVYVEVPVQKPKHLATLAKQLGKGAKKRLKKEGRVRDAGFAKKLRQAFTA